MSVKVGGFYHVIVETNDGKGQRCLFVNMTKTALKRRFIRPYNAGHVVMLDNHEMVDTTTIKKCHIRFTQKSADDEVSALLDEATRQADGFNRESSGFFMMPMYGWHQEDLVMAGEDHTGRFIKGPPGRSILPRWVRPFFTNIILPLAVALAGAYLIWKFGWNK